MAIIINNGFILKAVIERLEKNGFGVGRLSHEKIGPKDFSIKFDDQPILSVTIFSADGVIKEVQFDNSPSIRIGQMLVIVKELNEMFSDLSIVFLLN